MMVNLVYNYAQVSIIYITFVAEIIIYGLYIFDKIDSNIYFNTSFLIIEITIGISIAIIVYDRTKKSEMRIECTLEDIKIRAIQIDQAVAKLYGFIFLEYGLVLLIPSNLFKMS